MYCVIYKINYTQTIWKESSEKETEQVEELVTKTDLTIDHIQIDNMLSAEYPVFFTPKQQFDPENNSLSEDYTPFMQFSMTHSEIKDEDVFLRKYRALQFSI